MRQFLATVLLGMAITAVCQATDYTSAATVNATFQCPEVLASDEARAAELKAFLEWMRGQRPDWSMPKVTGYRLYLLEERHCDKTLAAIQATKAVH
jgi:hypothetical protein